MIKCVAKSISSTNLYYILISYIAALFRRKSHFKLISKLVENICIGLQCLYGLQLTVQAKISTYNERKSDENYSGSK